jgi:hypothetical protein
MGEGRRVCFMDVFRFSPPDPRRPSHPLRTCKPLFRVVVIALSGEVIDAGLRIDPNDGIRGTASTGLRIGCELSGSRRADLRPGSDRRGVGLTGACAAVVAGGEPKGGDEPSCARGSNLRRRNRENRARPEHQRLRHRRSFPHAVTYSAKEVSVVPVASGFIPNSSSGAFRRLTQ